MTEEESRFLEERRRYWEIYFQHLGSSHVFS